MSAVEDEPNDITTATMLDAKESRNLEKLDLKKFKEFIASL